MTHLSDEDRWQQWCDWFPLAFGNIQVLAHHRHVWKNVLHMLQTNQEISHSRTVNEWLTLQYTVTIAVGIRRQSQFRSKRRPTIARILHEIVENPRAATLARFGARAANPGLAAAAWDSLARGPVQALPTAQVQLDLDGLTRVAGPCGEWLDSVVTHFDMGVLTSTPTFRVDELNPALDELCRLAREYYSLFNPGVSTNVTPELPLGWTSMFEVPWKPSRFEEVGTDGLG